MRSGAACAAATPGAHRPSSIAGWQARLALHYHRDARGATVARDRHEGPLRVLRPLYPEGLAACHHVLVHPPGGIAGGDDLAIEATLGPGTHALVTTAGATRYYRTTGAAACQHATLRVADGARLEWLPLESIAFNGCRAENHVRIELAASAETIGWDVLTLGLPASGQPFAQGRFGQSIECPGRWLERGVIDADDRRLLDAPLGLAGRRTLGTLWFLSGSAIDTQRRDALLDAARAQIDGDALAATAGVSAVQPGVIVARVLAPAVEPAMALLTRVWRAWRQQAWGLAAVAPRVWRT